jgi:hypothetical protein
MRTHIRSAFVAAALLGLAAPAMAQVELSGYWARDSDTDNGYSREPVDLLGIPVNADGRAKALSYDVASLSATERQCQMYPPFYALTGPFGFRISSEQDPITQKLVAWKLDGWIDRDTTTIYMDGRPHPSEYAPHTHGGFSTGKWEGNTLTVVTTHTKMGDIKRHTSFSSDRATVTYRFTRYGDLMTVTGILEDPVYLAEPYVLTSIFRLSTGGQTFPLTACEPIEELPTLHEDPTLVPHYLPGKNPWVNELTQNRGIPLDATMGGPATMYPEYRKTLKDTYKPPTTCKIDCGAAQLTQTPPPAGGPAPAR